MKNGMSDVSDNEIRHVIRHRTRCNLKRWYNRKERHILYYAAQDVKAGACWWSLYALYSRFSMPVCSLWWIYYLYVYLIHISYRWFLFCFWRHVFRSFRWRAANWLWQGVLEGKGAPWNGLGRLARSSRHWRRHPECMQVFDIRVHTLFVLLLWRSSNSSWADQSPPWSFQPVSNHFYSVL